MEKGTIQAEQNTARNNSAELIVVKEGFPDQISFWTEANFRFEATTGEQSKKVQLLDYLPL